MSSFRVQKMKGSVLPISKQKIINNQTLTTTENIQINLNQISLLNYQIDTMLLPLQLQVQGQMLSRTYLKKNLKILSMSLNDKDLFLKIQNIFNRTTSKNDGIFQLLCQWSQLISLHLIFQNFSEKMKLKLFTIIYIKILIGIYQSTQSQRKSLKKQILKISNQLTQKQQQLIIYQFQNQIQLKKNSFSLSQFLELGQNILQLVRNCQNQKIKRFFLIFAQKFIAVNQLTFVKIIKQALFHDQKCKVFIQSLFLTSQTVKLKIILTMQSQINKLTTSQIYNYFNKQLGSKNASFFFIASFSHWINKSYQNIQKIVSQLFNFRSQSKHNNQNKKFIYQCSKYVDDQATFKKMLIANNIFSFFKSNQFQFDFQSKFDKQQLIQKVHSSQINISFYKNMKHCQNYRKTNLLLLNKSQQIQYWPKMDNLQSTILGKSDLKANFEQFLSDIKYIRSKLLKQNKAITIWYLVIQVQISKKTYFLTFHQLKKLINSQQIHLQQDKFLQQYEVSKKEKVLSINKEIHPIINQAKVVKFLKKSQKAVSDVQIAKFLQIKIQDCKLILNKLVNKGFIQVQQNSLKYSYLA